MKRIKALILIALLVGVPTVGLAGVDDFEELTVVDDFDDTSPVVPEPTAAVLMGVGLVTVGLALRRRR